MSNSRQSESPSQPSVGREGSRGKKVRQKRRGKGRKTEAKESLTPISKYLVKEEPPAPPTTQPSTSNTQRTDDDEKRSSTLAGPSTTERSDETRGGNGGQLEPTPPKAVAKEAVVEQGGRETSGKDGGVRPQPEEREGREGKGESGGGRRGVKASSSSSSRGLVQERGRRERKVEPKRSTDTPVVRRQVQSSIRDHFPVRRSGRKTKSEIEKEDFERMAQRLRNKDESGLKVVEVDGKGRGVVSTRRFSRGELVCEYSGELVSLEEAKEREAEYGKDPSIGCYVYYFSHKNNKLCVDATADNGRKGRLLNHSRTAANVVTRLVEVDGRPYLCLVAARDISVGEQLEYDYGERDRATMDSHPWLAS